MYNSVVHLFIIVHILLFKCTQYQYYCQYIHQGQRRLESKLEQGNYLYNILLCMRCDSRKRKKNILSDLKIYHPICLLTMSLLCISTLACLQLIGSQVAKSVMGITDIYISIYTLWQYYSKLRKANDEPARCVALLSLDTYATTSSTEAFLHEGPLLLFSTLCPKEPFRFHSVLFLYKALIDVNFVFKFQMSPKVS